MASSRIIVGIGEALFDVFPDGQRLGGAPLNVAVHARQLGNTGIVVSRVGQDELADQIIAELRRRDMTTAHLQSDPDHPTGTVEVDASDPSAPRYNILPGAWDHMTWDGDLDEPARRCHGVCFGSLAQRNAPSRGTIYRFLVGAKNAERLFDVNLRQDFYDRRSILSSLEHATSIKLNTEELATLVKLLNIEGGGPDAQIAALLRQYNLRWAALTAGEKGTTVYTPTQKFAGTPVTTSGGGGDAVGAGDAVAAALLHGVTRRWDWPRTLTLANTLGAFVASQPGACPELNDEIRQLAGMEK
ncbi:MAG: PfkB family carbohydrate kinase [Phycisphaerales bacterium]